MKKIIRNNSNIPRTWSGAAVPASGGLYEIDFDKESMFADDITLLEDISAGVATLTNGIEDYTYAQAKKLLQTTGGVLEEMTIPFNRDAQVDYVYSDDSTYAVVGNFIFKGTYLFEPTTIKLVTSRSSPSAQNAYCKIFDFDNGNDIAEIIWTDDGKSVQTSVNLDNLPETGAIFEVMLKTDDVNSEARLHSVHLY